MEIVHADDLIVFREFDHNASVDSVMTEAKRCQTELHKWCKAKTCGSVRCVSSRCHSDSQVGQCGQTRCFVEWTRVRSLSYSHSVEGSSSAIFAMTSTRLAILGRLPVKRFLG